MLNKQRIRLAVIGFAAVIFFGCPSQEYTSANVYIQQEEWAKAKDEINYRKDCLRKTLNS